MFRSALMSSLVALALIFAGPSAARADDQVDNPQFKVWTSFGIGSSATFQFQMQAGPKSITMTIVRKLVEKADDHIVVETTTITDAAGIQNPTPPQKMTIPAKAAKVEVKDLGTEDITAAGKTFSCKVHEVKGINFRQPEASAKVWLNSDVPGGIVKMEATTSGSTISQVLKSFEVK